jgi:hypothetical protein
MDGNKATNAGVYEVRARFKGDESNYYAIDDSVAYLTIERAVYDLSNVEFLNKTVTYSGAKHALRISENSKLPLDVEVSYQIQQVKDGDGKAVDREIKSDYTAINAGKYLVVAKFSINGKNAENYTTNPIEKEAYLTIERAIYDLSELEFFDKAVAYTGQPYEVKIFGEIPKEIGVSYKIEQIKDGAGKPVGENPYQANTNIATNAGEYLVTASFCILDEEIKKNYTIVPDEKQVTLTILRASYDSELENIQIQSQEFAFEGDKTYEIPFDFELPVGVDPQFLLTDTNGEPIQGERKVFVDETTGKTTYTYAFSVETAGEYSCEISFVHENENYDTITRTITVAVYISSVE